MDKVFSSWKEIAAYLGKGVRTVQRWESVLNLPVHRPTKQGIVLAYESELEEWAGRTAGQLEPNGRPAKGSARPNSELRERSQRLCAIADERIRELQATIQRAQAIGQSISYRKMLRARASGIEGRENAAENGEGGRSLGVPNAA